MENLFHISTIFIAIFGLLFTLFRIAVCIIIPVLIIILLVKCIKKQDENKQSRNKCLYYDDDFPVNISVNTPEELKRKFKDNENDI